MVKECSMHEVEEKCIYDCGEKARRKEINKRTYMQTGG
jgi:hypothetical protein